MGKADRLFACVAAVACAVAMCVARPRPARAAEAGRLVVQQEFTTEGKVPAALDGSFSYELRRVTDGAPLPSGASGEAYAFTLAGSEKATFSLGVTGDGSGGAWVVFDRAGSYDYELSCVSKGTSELAVDAARYRIQARVGTADDGSLMLVWANVYDASGEKVDVMAFSHAYRGAPEVRPQVLPRTGDDVARWGVALGVAVIVGLGLVTVGAVLRRRG